MKKTFTLIFFFAYLFSLKATHNRAGEITYTWLSGTTYRVTITTYTKDSAPADRCTLDLDWGDGTNSTLKRSNGQAGGANPCTGVGALPGEPIGNDVRKNIYQGTHTYNSSGAYIVSFEDPNRNAGVNNIPNSVQVPFYVQSQIIVSPGLGGNSSPILTNPPIDDGCVNQRYEHSAGAFDAEGDSLSYQLVPCRSAGGQPINGVYNVQDSVEIDPVTGLLIWDVPQNAGQYNFAFEISEWRKNGTGSYEKIGYVVRDLQINIEQCPQQRPPELQELGPFCVEAGQLLDFTIQATDPDNDPISLRAFGDPYQVNNPANPLQTIGSNPANGRFTWTTACNHVRQQPYYLTIEAKDDPTNRNPQLTPLVDLSVIEIEVVAPSPKNPVAVSDEGSINLSWDQSICPQVNEYKIYRREESYGFVPSECETGVPEYTGYELLDTVAGLTNTSYQDSNDLKRGVRYCYMVVACFPDGSESYASVEFCNSLPLSQPMMTNVDVLTTDNANGSIEVKWVLPPELDSSLFPPPYSFKLYRARGRSGSDFSEIQSLTDTFFVDNGLNTQDSAYRYKVEMLFGPNDTRLGEADPASSIFLQITPNDKSNILRFGSNTPWKNDSYVIYRENPTSSGNFESIDTAFTSSYTDTGLVNGELYCYKVMGIGAYTATDSLDRLPEPLFNNSQEACSSPIDTTSPCAPRLSGTFYCEQDSLYFEWENPSDSGCIASDIKEYRLYYKPTREEQFGTDYITLPASAGTSVSLTEQPLIGCYAITAVDDAASDPNGQENESVISEVFCASPCPDISFPNVFTPNGDGSNDYFTAINYKNIGDLYLQIFNRWGSMVYETNDARQFLEVGWNGVNSTTGQPCADGVYYFICRYTPQSLDNPQPKEVTGFLHLFAE